MILVSSIKFHGFVPGVNNSQVNIVIRETLGDLAAYWHEHMRAKHFTVAGAREYGYLPRRGERGNMPRIGFKRSYTGRKLKAMGHTRPLVYTGESEEMTRIRDIRVHGKTATVVLHAPKLNWRNRYSQIHMWEEMTTVSEPELQELSRLFGRVMEMRLRAIPNDLTRKIEQLGRWGVA